MTTAITLEEMKGNYDWEHAFYEAVHHQYGPDEGLGPLEHVTEILHSVAGENDESSWLAIGRWDDGKFFVMDAGCDYTGWDCQASGTMEFHDTLGEALTDLTPEQARRLGLPHDAERTVQ